MNEKWMWAAIAAMSLCSAGGLALSKYNESQVAIACVRAGGEWKQPRFGADHECVRPRAVGGR